MRDDQPLRFAAYLSLGFLLFFLAFLPPGIYSLDGNSMLAVAESLVTSHSVSVPPGLGEVGTGGRIYSSWYPLLSLISVPLVSLAHLVAEHVHLPFHYLAAVFALVVQVPLTAATAGLVALLSLHLGATRLGAWLASLCFGLGTIAMVYVRTFYAEPLLAFLVAISLYLAFRLTTRSIVSCSFLALLAVLAKPSGIFVGVVLSAYLIAKRMPWLRAILPSVGSVCGLALYAAYNQYRFGHPLQFGPPWLFIPSEFPVAVLGLLVSPAWGLIWYCPALVLAIFGIRAGLRSKFIEVLAIVSVFAAFLLFHSLYKGWWAGWGWGPRYLVPTLPGLCSLTGLLKKHAAKALVALSLAGFLINAPTLVSFYERHFAELSEHNIYADAGITWSFSLAPCLNGWPAAIRQVRDASHHDVRELFAQRGEPSQVIDNSRALRIVALWWWVLPLAKIPHWIGFLLSVCFVGFGIFMLLAAAPPNSST